MSWLACSQSNRFFASTMQILGKWAWVVRLGGKFLHLLRHVASLPFSSTFFISLLSSPFFLSIILFLRFYQICYMKDHFNLQVKTSLLLLWYRCLWFCSLSDFIGKRLLYNTEYQWCECAPWPSSCSHFTTNTAAVGPLGTFFYKVEEVSF